MLKYLILFVAGLGVSLLLTPWVRGLATKLGAIDLPEGRKIHTRPIPRLGGLSIFISFHLILLIASQFDFFYFPSDFLQQVNFWWILLASAIVFGMGAVDDFRRMPPRVKFFFQIIAGLMVAMAGYKIEIIGTPFGDVSLGNFAIPATVFWVVAITNAINLLDGLDGLASGTVFIVSFAMFGIALLGQDIGSALICILFAGSILGFLKYNFHPASIFLGDSGAYFLGFQLAILSLHSGLKGTTTFAILIPILALGIPIMDTLLAMLRRLLKSLHIMDVDPEKNTVKFFFLDGWSMFTADRGHIHHRLIDLGLTQKKAVILLYGISIILGGLVLLTVYFRNVNQALLLGTIGIAAYLGVRRLGYREIQVLSNGALLPLFDAPGVNRRFLRVFLDIGIIAVSYYLALLLRFEGTFTASVKEYYLSTLPLMLSSKILVFYAAGLYRGGWRYTSVSDLVRMVKAVTLGCAASAVLLWLIPGIGLISRAVVLIDFNLLLFLIVGVRSSFRVLEHLHISQKPLGRKALIYGVGKTGVSALRELVDNPGLELSPAGFIDDNHRNLGKQILGYPVLGTLESLEHILKADSASEVILAINEFPKERLDRLSQICSTCQIPLRRFQARLEKIPPQ